VSADAIARCIPELSRGIEACQGLGGTLPEEYVAAPSFFVQAPRARLMCHRRRSFGDRHRNFMQGLEEVDLKAIEDHYIPARPPSAPRRAWISTTGAHVGAGLVRSPVGFGLSMRHERYERVGRTSYVEECARDSFFRCPHYKSCGGTIISINSPLIGSLARGFLRRSNIN
jgi:hypothetical protein